MKLLKRLRPIHDPLSISRSTVSDPSSTIKIPGIWIRCGQQDGVDNRIRGEMSLGYFDP